MQNIIGYNIPKETKALPTELTNNLPLDLAAANKKNQMMNTEEKLQNLTGYNITKETKVAKKKEILESFPNPKTKNSEAFKKFFEEDVFSSLIVDAENIKLERHTEHIDKELKINDLFEEYDTKLVKEKDQIMHSISSFKWEDLLKEENAYEDIDLDKILKPLKVDYKVDR